MADVRRILADLWGKKEKPSEKPSKNFCHKYCLSVRSEFCKAMDYLLNIKECHPS